MERELTASELALLALLRRSLTGHGDMLSDAALALAPARECAVTALLYGALDAAALDRAEFEPLRRETTGCVLRFYRLLFLTRYYVDILRRAGVETVVLKGAGAAAHYPVPEYRKSGDVDLLLLNPGDADTAHAALESAGVYYRSMQHANHHREYAGADGISLELHLAVVEDFDNRRANARIAELCGSLSEHVVRREILPGVSLPVAEDAWQALFLLLHMLQHFLLSGLSLRLLCDWTVFWNRPVEQEQTQRYLAMAEYCGVAEFSHLVTRACEAYLGLEERYAAALLADGAEDTDRLCAAFLREVLDTRESGNADERMVVPRGAGPGALLREFHHQMLLNYPRAGRIVLLWPILWLMAVFRFLRNNRTLRNTSVRAVLRDAKRRGALRGELRLFQWNS